MRADLLFGAAGRLQFPFLFGGTFIEGKIRGCSPCGCKFPFLFGGTFIEGPTGGEATHPVRDFPSFSEGLSLREKWPRDVGASGTVFPFLFGGTFIEGPLDGCSFRD